MFALEGQPSSGRRDVSVKSPSNRFRVGEGPSCAPLWGVARRAHHDPDYAQRARRLLYPSKIGVREGENACCSVELTLNWAKCQSGGKPMRASEAARVADRNFTFRGYDRRK